MNKQPLRQVHLEIDRRSEGLFQNAVRFADKYPPPSSSQASGLWNVINSEPSINSILTTFVQHQADKSTSQNSEFWKGLKRELDGLRKEAEGIQQQLALPLEKGETQKGQRDEIHLMLARDYIQHLVAHTIYRRTQTGGR